LSKSGKADLKVALIVVVVVMVVVVIVVVRCSGASLKLWSRDESSRAKV